MAYLTTWNITDLPSEMIDILEKDIEQFDDWQDDSRVMGNEVAPKIRNSKNAWISTDHWIAGWIWYYIQKANRENFLYDLYDIDGGSIQYTHYGAGDYYTWHNDGDISTAFKPKFKPGTNTNISEDQVFHKGECVRKLSFSLQLSDPKDYRGGEVEFHDSSNKRYFAPKQRGTLIVFDSRLKHRVRTVKSGLRKSIVGWVVGPRWR
tara:strand:- start:1355 stop:1972 length:618 start_codon:yes stop_codon:yes gene_type:complete